LAAVAIKSDAAIVGLSPPLSRDSQAWRQRVLLHRPRNWTKPTLYLVRVGDRRCAVKDQRLQPAWFRRTVGRCLLKREAEAFRRLLPVSGVPDFAGWIDEDAFATTYVEARRISDASNARPPDIFFQRLDEMFREIHGLGVAHGDPHADNILLDAQGQPHLVDFAVAQFDDGSLVARWLYRQALLIDRRKLAKLKRQLAPHLLTDGDRAALEEPALHRALRSIARRPRRFLKRKG
jgi:tRNA A-37 threonylcarbamoyl transferase component Bud32